MAEKSLTALPRELRILFTRGSDALSRDNFDYAIDLFTQVLAKEPEVYEVRKALRIAQSKRHGKGSGFFKKVLSGASAAPLITKGQIALRSNPAEALAVAEQILNHDPLNNGGHRIVVEAARVLELPRTAVMSYDVLHRNSPKDREIAIAYATALADTGSVDKGEAVLVDLYNEYPRDNELALALKNISARKTMDEGGYDDLADGTGSYRDILKDKDEAVALEQQNRQVKTEDVTERLIGEYEARLRTEPENLKLLRSLAELYTQKKDFDRALGYYEKVKATDMGNDPALDRAIADTNTRKMEHQIQQLDQSSPEFAEQTAALQSQKQDYQLQECQKRVERFPTDLGIRFEMGVLYFKAGKVGEAIQEFQKAEGNPHKRIAAMNYLAQCFAKRRMFDLAARKFQAALKEKPAFDEEKKELTYNLGTVLDSMGKKEEAVEQYKLIYEVDIGYRDVAAKVDAFYSSQG
jgi:tetratricopeptide (TPR) repeat protein